MTADTPPCIWTVGHSTHELAGFLELLTTAGIEHVADVRRHPGSRRFPHFESEALRASLAAAGIGYTHLPELGGRRGRPAPDSPNSGWRVAQFAAYADYMASEAFGEELSVLMELATQRPTAMMCSEAVPWRCHRRLIADALVVHGWQVLDIMAKGHVEPHRLTEFAKIEDGVLTYPAG